MCATEMLTVQRGRMRLGVERKLGTGQSSVILESFSVLNSIFVCTAAGLVMVIKIVHKEVTKVKKFVEKRINVREIG